METKWWSAAIETKKRLSELEVVWVENKLMEGWNSNKRNDYQHWKLFRVGNNRREGGIK